MEEQTRYAAMVERLTALGKQRQIQAEARRLDAAQSANPLESPAAFHSEFQQQLQALEQRLASASSKPDLDSIAVALAGLDKSISDASYFLPPYDLQSSRSAIDKLNLRLRSSLAQLIPRKKFAFRNRNPKPNPVSQLSQPGSPGPQEDELPTPLPLSMECIREKQDATVVHDAGESGDSEVMLTGLTRCSVFLRGRFRALFFHKLTDCKVYAGAVAGSIMVEEAERCVLMLASHQVRIHSSRDSDFYLRVRSRPIVEYVSNVRFAPYGFSYRGIEEDLRGVGLEEETGLWDKVDDFRWLRAAASPNWSVLPPHERAPLVDGSCV